MKARTAALGERSQASRHEPTMPRGQGPSHRRRLRSARSLSFGGSATWPDPPCRSGNKRPGEPEAEPEDEAIEEGEGGAVAHDRAVGFHACLTLEGGAPAEPCASSWSSPFPVTLELRQAAAGALQRHRSPFSRSSTIDRTGCNTRPAYRAVTTRSRSVPQRRSPWAPARATRRPGERASERPPR